MKWFHLPLVAFMTFTFNACQQHPASQLEVIDDTKEQPVANTQDKKPHSENAPAAATSEGGPKFFK